MAKEMRRSFFLFVFIIACSMFGNGLSSDVHAQTFTIRSLIDEREGQAVSDTLQDWPGRVQAGLRGLLADPMFERSQVALYVYDLTADSALFAHGHRQLMRPASTEKLMTAVASLAQLGCSYQFETKMYRTGELVNSVLQGDLYIVGGFDPLFGYGDLCRLVGKLAESGVNHIAGRVRLDVSMKDTLRFGLGWCWDDDLDPLVPLTVDGRVDFTAALMHALDEAGITYYGVPTTAVLPPRAVLVGTCSHSIDQILSKMLKKSDNFYAEALFYQLGRRRGAVYPSGKESARCIERFIAELGLNPSDYRIADGSGLSLYNYLTPEVLVETLRYAYRSDNLYSYLTVALPLAGCDGTLERRMTSGNAYANVRAKTGTVEGVSTLAGYATAANGHMLCFAIMNQGILKQSTARKFQDRVCEVLTSP